jgi:hypothetical protein
LHNYSLGVQFGCKHDQIENIRQRVNNVKVTQEDQLFKPLLVRKLLKFSIANLRKLKKEVDPNGEKRGLGFTHNALFIYSVFRSLIDNNHFTVTDICRYDWNFIFEFIEKYGIDRVKKMSFIYRQKTSQVWLVTRDVHDRLHDAGWLRAVPFIEGYETYNDCLTSLSKPQIEIKDDALESLIAKQKGYKELINTPVRIDKKLRDKAASFERLMKPSAT